MLVYPEGIPVWDTHGQVTTRLRVNLMHLVILKPDGFWTKHLPAGRVESYIHYGAFPGKKIHHQTDDREKSEVMIRGAGFLSFTDSYVVGPPNVTRLLIHPMNTTVIGAINHSEIRPM